MKPIELQAYRQTLLKDLEALTPAQQDALLRSLEQRQERKQPVFSSLLHVLAHLSFSESEARRHWRRVALHRERLGAELSRDPGLRVALLDYFQNVSPALKNPKLIELAVYERTERSAMTDGLTGLYNHAFFLQALRREVQRTSRHGHRTSLLLIDLDDFKRLNDTRGHLEGDRVLARTAALVRERLREVDVAARYGGEEFAVILPDTARTGAYVAAERIRSRVEQHFARRRDGLRLTLSGGVATCPDDAGSVEELIRCADAGLYRSKSDGKNRITLASGERRRHLRVRASHRVTLDAPPALRKRVARARNVSEGGLLVRAGQALPVGTTLDLLVRPQGAKPVPVRGEVVRVQGLPDESAFDLGVKLFGEADGLLISRRSGNA